MIKFNNTYCIIPLRKGSKSIKDKKLIWPIVEQINEFQNSLNSKSDKEIKQRYIDLKTELRK